MKKDPFTRWVDRHPATIFYIAMIVTAIFILQVLQIAGILDT